MKKAERKKHGGRQQLRGKDCLKIVDLRKIDEEEMWTEKAGNREMEENNCSAN